MPVPPLPVLPVEPVLPVLPLVPPLPVVPPPPTGAAPPEADDTGIVVVVVDGGVVVVVVLGGVVVVVVVDVEVPVAPAAGLAGPVPTTARTAVGGRPSAGGGVLATMALPWAEDVLPAKTGPLPPDWLTVPLGAVLAGPAGRPALGTVVVVVLECEETGPIGGEHALAIGPAPMSGRRSQTRRQRPQLPTRQDGCARRRASMP